MIRKPPWPCADVLPLFLADRGCVQTQFLLGDRLAEHYRVLRSSHTPGQTKTLVEKIRRLGQITSREPRISMPNCMKASVRGMHYNGQRIIFPAHVLHYRRHHAAPRSEKFSVGSSVFFQTAGSIPAIGSLYHENGGFKRVRSVPNGICKWLVSTLLGGVFYLGQTAVAYSEIRAENAHPIAPPSVNVTGVVQGKSSVSGGQYQWQAFLKLAAIPDTVVTVKDFEDAFGKKAAHNEQADFSFYRIQDIATLTVASVDFVRKRYPHRTSRMVSFHVLGGHTLETCITRTRAVKDLQGLGWALHTHFTEKLISGNFKEWMPSHVAPATDTFLKGDQGIISLFYWEGTECVNSASMQADRFAFDELIKSPTKSISEDGHD